MEPIAWQIVSSLVDGRTIHRTIQDRRRLADAVLRVGESRDLFLFSGPDTHLHLATAASRTVAGELARAAEISLRSSLALPVPFAEARITPIRDQGHLWNTVRYVLGNARKHGNHTDPRCEGTNLPDLLGLRLTGRYTAFRLKQLLPRLTRRDLLVHLPIDNLYPGLTPCFLPDAACAALALPDLSARDRRTRQARIAAVHVADQLGLLTAHAAELLRTSDRTVRRHRSLSAPPLLVRAIQLQMGLMEDTVRSGPGHGSMSGVRAAP